MRIPIDRDSQVPMYRQIERWLRHDITAGTLPAGTRLPSTRAMADKLGVGRITVVNAYATLECDGLVVTGAGSGTFVAATTTPAATARTAPPGRDGRGGPAAPGRRRDDGCRDDGWPLWQDELAASAAAQPPDPPPATPPGDAHPSPIAFAGVGDPRLFPAVDLARTVREVLASDGTAALAYGQLDGGYEPLRTTIVRMLASQGIRADARQVLVTSGSQQALALTCQVLLGPGDTVLVEEPTYNLALELFRAHGLHVVGVPMDDRGMRVDLLEPLLQRHHPRLIYTIPNFQNPTGTCLSGSRRRELLALADRYNVPIAEDDFAGDLRYEGRAQPAIKALDSGGHVIYIGTFSKLLAPGLRVGYLIADGPVFEHLLRRKRVADLTTTPLLQRALERYVTLGRYQSHLRRTTRLYRQRRDVLVEQLRRHLPDASVEVPRGGLFAWLRLPEPVGSRALLWHAAREGVEFAAGSRFFPDPGDGEAYLRLNFAAVGAEDIPEGVARLRRTVEQARLRPAP